MREVSTEQVASKYEVGRKILQERVIHLDQILKSIEREPTLTLKRLDFMEEREICLVRLNYLKLKEMVDNG